MRKIKNKKAFEMSFAWLFSIIVGAVILFLAIYMSSNYISSRRTEIDAQTEAKLSILLDPLETSLEAGKATKIIFSKETRIQNDKCLTSGNFGEQRLGISTSSNLGKKWQKPLYGSPQYNKYVFSQSVEQGKEFSVFSMPFDMPFKVSDLIFLSSRKYCFIQTPNEIKDNLEGLSLDNVEFVETKSNCSQDAQSVCFDSASGCDIIVYGSNLDFTSGTVIKDRQTMYYTGPLLYGAIFSSPGVYECNVKRLMLRLVNLCLIYEDKIKFVEKRGCNSVLEAELVSMLALARDLKSSQELFGIQSRAEQIEKINDAAICKIF